MSNERAARDQTHYEKNVMPTDTDTEIENGIAHGKHIHHGIITGLGLDEFVRSKPVECLFCVLFVWKNNWIQLDKMVQSPLALYVGIDRTYFTHSEAIIVTKVLAFLFHQINGFKVTHPAGDQSHILGLAVWSSRWKSFALIPVLNFVVRLATKFTVAWTDAYLLAKSDLFLSKPDFLTNRKGTHTGYVAMSISDYLFP